jgi:CSLREA domain-containing protein
MNLQLVVVAALFAASNAHALDVLAPGDLAPAALAIDAQPNGPASNGNRVLEPGESVVVAPSWLNRTATPINATSVASAFTGPGLATLYAINDATASYVVPAGQPASCAATGNCFTLTVGAPATRPAAHWDAMFGETTSTGSGTTWIAHVGDSFPDVARASVFYPYIETILHHGLTGGCPAGSFCPAAPMTREWMAPFVLGSRERRYYVPPSCASGGEMFTDVPATSPNCRWVEELARRGVVTGCGSNLYCPTATVTREQLAVFILVTREGASYSPPPCVAGSERFSDVPASSPFCRWVEELARRNVVTGCAANAYCPASPVSREQMSVFLSVTFGLSLYGAPSAYFVNTADDVDDGACTPAHCSLREAVAAANATPNPAGVREEIRFAIPGAGPHAIHLAGALPWISEAVVIDGYSQPGASPNSLYVGSNAVLQIEVDLGATALVVQSDNVAIRGLAINGSSGPAVAIRGNFNRIEGCFIGTDVTGTIRVANVGAGVLVGGVANRIGGTFPAQRNVLSGSSYGVSVDGASTTLVQGNLIGTDRTGTAAIANTIHGVEVVATQPFSQSGDTLVGGLPDGAGNVISGNGGSGVQVAASVSPFSGIVGRTTIQSNIIGMDATGAAPLPNAAGVFLVDHGVSDTMVGGLTAVPAGNLIGGSSVGVAVQQTGFGGPTGTQIQGNRILLTGVAIRLDAVGGNATRNVIGPSTLFGIQAHSGVSQWTFRANSISNSGMLGIDLFPPNGVNPNDPGDGDIGPNGLQNHPVITSALRAANAVAITGVLSSRPSSAYTIELFASGVAGPSGYGDGEASLGTLTVSTNAAGDASFSVVVPAAVPPGYVITATATDSLGQTSEFSPARAVQ